MSATDEPRRLLDERGAEYYLLDESIVHLTMWQTCYEGLRHECQFDERHGESKLEIWDCTPEQAIAATLGNGTCEYCNGAMPIPYQYADGFSGWIEIVIDGATLFVQVGNDELAIPINYCPNCGRAVKQ